MNRTTRLLITLATLSFVYGCKPVPTKETTAELTRQATIAHQKIVIDSLQSQLSWYQQNFENLGDDEK